MHCILNFSHIYSDESFSPSESAHFDFSDVEGTCCYCDACSLSLLREALKGQPYSGVHWIDGGDYHYVSLLFAEKIDRDFCLVLFDNHSDDQEVSFGGDILSCGSWVGDVRRLPHCKCDLLNRIDVPSDLPVYLSIDKDVMSPEFARTNWDQGEMTLDELESMVSSLAAAHTILGVDVCGGLSRAKGATDDDVALNRSTDLRLASFLERLVK